jgi:hypothetical protein
MVERSPEKSGQNIRPSVGHPIEAGPSLAAQFQHRNAHDHAALSKWVTKRRATRGSEGSQPRSALTP